MFSPKAFAPSEEKNTRLNVDRGARYGSSSGDEDIDVDKRMIEEFIFNRKYLIKGDQLLNITAFLAGMMLLINGCFSIVHFTLHLLLFPVIYELIVVVMVAVMLLYQWENISGRKDPHPSLISTGLSHKINRHLQILSSPIGRLFVYLFYGLVELSFRGFLSNIVGCVVIILCGYCLYILFPYHNAYEAIKEELRDDDTFKRIFSCSTDGTLDIEFTNNLLQACTEFADLPDEITALTTGKIDYRIVQYWLIHKF